MKYFYVYTFLFARYLAERITIIGFKNPSSDILYFISLKVTKFCWFMQDECIRLKYLKPKPVPPEKVRRSVNKMLGLK
tara:strand:- start:584 stop:817 length:234 start_codon:yes stop_codon:yes gene_type:complete